jgi:GT2 family glycosyltransferase
MKISVVMPSYNQGDFVEEAIRSFLDQDYPDKELLFIDGGSSDSTLQKVEPYRRHLAAFVSEPDRGQSDALRKGFALASGDVLTWLNTDDLLLPGILGEVASLFRAPSTEWVFGNVVWIDAAGSIIAMRKGERDSLPTRMAGVMTACGPSAFFRRELLEAVGGVDNDLHYKMDTDLWFRFRSAGVRFRRTRRYAWALRLHEDAKVGSQFFAPEIAARHSARIAREAEVLRDRHGLPRSAPGLLLAKLTAATAKLSSPAWLSSRLDSRRWRGRGIAELMADRICGHSA